MKGSGPVGTAAGRWPLNADPLGGVVVAEQHSESRDGTPGKVAPVVDRNRCEGKEDCIRVCPYNVFEIGTLSKAEKSGLTLLGRVKSWAHGGKQAFVVNPGECHACQLSIEACPEDALKLAPWRG